MRILFPTLAAFPTSDAPAVQVGSMAQAFGELGHHVVLLSPVAGTGDVTSTLGRPAAFHHVALSARVHRGQSYLHALRIARLVARGDVDLVFARNLRACLLPARRGIPTVFEAHTLSSLTGRQDRWVLRQLRRSPGFRGIVAISQALADDLVDELEVDPAMLLVAHDAVHVAPADPGTDHATDRAEDGATAPSREPGAPMRIGYTGSLFPGKGADALLDIASACPWATFAIAGGPDALAAALRRRASDEALTNVVVHGSLAPVEARALQRDCDVLVAPFARRIESDSGHDIARWTSPMKVFEYMASGRPIVISDLPVLREVLRPDVDALMVPPEDPTALIAALERLRDEPELGVRLAASALERVRSEFTWELRARRILERFVPEAA
jgi:glycosyltransferase involved in cell wall biosynthesis